MAFLAKLGALDESDGLIGFLGSLAAYPKITISDILEAAKSIGISLSGVRASIDETAEITVPFLALLQGDSLRGASAVLVDKVYRQKVSFTDAYGVRRRLSTQEFYEMWGGIAIIGKKRLQPSNSGSEFASTIKVFKDFVTPYQCAEIIRYCEDLGFSASRVLQRRGNDFDSVVERSFRSSSSVLLGDRQHPLVFMLYEKCALREGVSINEIETIQCVRYKRGQRFRPHLDSNSEMARMVTYLLYLNTAFEGGETYFPLLNLSIEPEAGACLRFQSCDAEGRASWLSQHGGQPVKSGTKYALNIWVRTPKSNYSEFAVKDIKPDA